MGLEVRGRTVASPESPAALTALRLGKSTEEVNRKLAGAWEIASNRLNRIKRTLIVDSQGHESEFGQLLDTISNKSELNDHGFPHLRRVERYMLAAVFHVNSVQEVVLGQNQEFLIDAALLAITFHDTAQLLALHDEEENPKKQHGERAALMILANYRKYAEATGLSEEEAWERSAAAAIMVMKHDVPEEYQDVLSGSVKAGGLSGDELIHAYDDTEHRLDLSSLAPSQLIEILRHKFEQPEETGNYRLNSQFEQEYDSVLEELASGDRGRRPLLEKVGKGELLHEPFKITAELFLFADVADMIAPPGPAVIRTLLTKWSKARPLLAENISADTLWEQIIDKTGNVAGETDSDVRRLFWEFLHMVKIFGHMDITQTEWGRQFLKDHIMMGYLEVVKAMGKLLSEDPQEGKHAFDGVYLQRIQGLSRKALLRQVKTQEEIDAVNELIERWQGRNLSLEEWNSSTGQELRSRGISEEQIGIYTQSVEDIIKERDTLESSLSGELQQDDSRRRFKPRAGKSADDHGYTEQDRMTFAEVAKRMEQELTLELGVTSEEMDEYRDKVRRNEYPRSFPLTTYDPSGFGRHSFLEEQAA